ncbi:hypothetical protein [Asticcacaulis sp.]|uniref:hypothetical protein n=1 Tax=Asticcacaulis sp. TaxID=1872648 RepID=UPI003F7C0987
MEDFIPVIAAIYLLSAISSIVYKIYREVSDRKAQKIASRAMSKLFSLNPNETSNDEFIHKITQKTFSDTKISKEEADHYTAAIFISFILHKNGTLRYISDSIKHKNEELTLNYISKILLQDKKYSKELISAIIDAGETHTSKIPIAKYIFYSELLRCNRALYSKFDLDYRFIEDNETLLSPELLEEINSPTKHLKLAV